MRATWLVLAAWSAFAAYAVARGVATGTLPNALAGDIAQSAAFATLAGAALLLLTHARPGRIERAGLGAMILLLALGVALGHPWHGLAGAPLVALLLVPLALRPAAWSALAAGLGWAVAAWGMLAAEPDVALLSYVLPGAILLAAASWQALLRPGQRNAQIPDSGTPVLSRRDV